MIQLIKEGPQIPEEIEQALRHDNLVFFCGAGISVANGLPLFNDLVKKVCEKLKVNIDGQSLLRSAEKRGDYSSVLDLLEGNSEFSVQPKILRKEIINILSNYNGKPDIHKALLELSALPDNKGRRLVTTNFDRLFFEAGLKSKFSDSAPKLAPPRKEKWKNLTFLHGVIDDNDPEGGNLVLTKTDFGLAYLHDNWAARFVIQLFQDWTVLFVGYSVNDPVMDYLVSAISYENRRKNNLSKTYEKNQIKPSIYAFVGYKEDQKQDKEDQWKSIGVEPVPYKIKDNTDHSLLYDTIKQWAELKRTGLSGKKNWLNDQLKTPYKEGVDREKAETVISFLKDDKLEDYLPKINFSSDPKKIQPVDISWLRAFSEPWLESKSQNNLLKKLTCRTAQSSPYSLWEPLSPIEKNIASWLCYHLDKKELIHWFIKQSSIQSGLIELHPEFKDELKWKLKENNTIDKRKALFWNIVTSQKNQIERLPSYERRSLINDLNKNYSYSKIRELLFCLEPQIGFKAYFYNENFSEFLDSDKIYETKLEIRMDYPSLESLKDEIVLRHAEDWTNLLKKAMELAEWAELIEDGHDPFYIQRPSIADHEQNKNYYSWTYLIDLTRDSFDLAMDKDKKLAELLLNKWRSYPYSLFYRLILYAVTKHPDLDEDIAIDLFKNNKSVLWSPSFKNEVLRYLSDRQHAGKEAKKLLSLIMEGPDRSLNIDEKLFTKLKERNIYQRLNQLKTSEVQLPENIEIYYNKIQSKYNISKKREDSDNFPFFHTRFRRLGSEKRYHSMTDEQIFEDIKHTEPNTLPTVNEKKEEFCSFFKDLPDGPGRAFKILSMFQDNDLNSAPYWEEFIFEASMMTDAEKSKKYFLKSFEKIEYFNDSFFKECLWPLIHGFNMKGGLIYYEDKQRFNKWWRRLWKLSLNGELPMNNSDFASGALNSHLGKLSQSIFYILWSKFPDGKIPKNGKMPEDIKEYFEVVLQEGKEKDPSALFHFGSYLSQLCYLDREWTIKHLKPLMSRNKPKTFQGKNKPAGPLSAKNSQSQNSARASKPDECVWKALWQGYLFHDMFLGPDFLEDFKKEFFDLLLNYEQILIDNHQIEYIENIALVFFTATGGQRIQNIFSDEKSKKLIQKLDVDILESLSRQIWILLKDTETNKSAVLWSEKIKPWIEKFWPPQTNRKSPKIAENLSLSILHCEDKLSEAFETLKDKIEEEVITEDSSFIANHIINQAGLKDSNKNKQMKDSQSNLSHIFDYPDELLQLLNWNFPKRIYYNHDKKIKKILDKLKTKHPNIEEKEQYKILLDKINHD